MAWIESHQTLREHPKVYVLVDALGVSKAQIIGHLHLFWWWCVDYAPDGVISQNDVAIARAAEWSGDPKLFVTALVTAGFLDRRDDVLVIHDWGEYRLHYDLLRERQDRQKEQTRERVRLFREKKRIGNVTVTQCNAPKVPKKTVPKKKVQNQTKPENVVEVPEDLKSSEAIILEWIAYKRERGQSYKPLGIKALWGTLRCIAESDREEAIRGSMANNYAGIFPPKGGQNGPKQTRIVGEAAPVPGKYAHLSSVS